MHRIRVGEGEGPENIREVTAGFVEDALLYGREIVAAISGERVLVDCDYRAVFAQQQPRPDTVTVWEMVLVDNIRVTRGPGVFRSIEGIVSETDIVSSKIDARIVPEVIHDAVDIPAAVRFVVGDRIVLRQLVRTARILCLDGSRC